ncbi:hypothetical protein [Undibacterium sp. SXout20W]|uniref:hypothetical protein n=1 Tax=Undibacterium sp. SXout20W TaxID=3413051 RepID=UPI003BF0FD59
MKPRLFSKTLLGVIAVLAVSTASTSAFSQSAEYRLGYDQGYRDAMAAQQQEGHRDAGRMTIMAARYGTHEEACDASEAIRRIAGWRRHVEFQANNNLCGDPAMGRQKHLFVEYRCSNGPVQRVEARENDVLSLYCQ